MQYGSNREKIDNEHSLIHKKWKINYFIIDNNDKPTCLIRLQKITVAKEYNVRRHEETNHIGFVQYTGKLLEDKSADREKALKKQQLFLKNIHHLNEGSVKASHAISQHLSYSTTSQSRNTTVERVADINRDLESQLSMKEEFVELIPMIDTTTPDHVYQCLVECLDRLCIDWKHAEYGHRWSTSKDMQERWGRNNSYSHKNSVLRNEFTKRLGDCKIMKNSFGIFRNPFSTNALTAPEEFQMEVVDIQYDSILKDNYSSVDAGIFYTFTGQKCITLTAFSTRILEMLRTIYVCEQLFSVMDINTSKYRSKLTQTHLNAAFKVSSAQTLTSDLWGLVSVKFCQISGTKNY
ncbi:hypothetical protein RF11_05772 [Thelohanellus kitauei]|uniref:Uncharacterized protein n=1 Tax=Thelohanellus kitauei TaxID=669202 RepID=A0A0C2J1L7_THEKT|nr:hypothetical protein RF11_05772 [Thelohanellus kitauei]